MDKRGTHVGIILSFAIFVIFLVFLYSVTEPAIKIQKDKQALLDYLERALIEQTYVEMKTSTLSINATAPQDCIEIENLITELEMNSRIRVKNEFEDTTPSYISETNPDNLLIDRDDSGNRFFKIYNSEEFEEISARTINPCKKLKKEDEDYTIGLTRTETNIFETKIINLINEYKNNYETLKNELKIPAGSEFGFSFTYSNGTKIETLKKEVSTSVYAKEVPIQYVDKESSISSGFINIKVW